MQFTPKTEKEIAESMLLPAGDYDFTVIRAEETKSKAGNPMMKITLGIYQPDGTQRLVTDYVMEAFPRKLRHFAEVIGLLAQYELGSLGADECEGRAGKVKLIIKEQENFDPKNEVKDYVVNRKSGEKPTPSFVNKPLPGEEDDLPI